MRWTRGRGWRPWDESGGFTNSLECQWEGEWQRTETHGAVLGVRSDNTWSTKMALSLFGIIFQCIMLNNDFLSSVSVWGLMGVRLGLVCCTSNTGFKGPSVN